MTLLMRDQENIEKGIQKGILGAVELLCDAGWEDYEIKTAIMKKYSLTENEADEYLYNIV